MINILLVAIGSALGGLSRYFVSINILKFFVPTFPFGTLVVNTVGSFLIGLLFVLFVKRFAGIADELSALMIVGFLGGFTTFSSFSLETIFLIQNDEAGKAIINVLLSVGLCLTMTWLGILLGKALS